MRNRPDKFVKLVALNRKGIFERIPNHVLRKPADKFWQTQNLYRDSVLITCNYGFKEDIYEWSDHIKAFCHGFHDCKLPKDRPHFLFSESDFCDALITPVESPNRVEGYDFAYFTINSMQGITCKGLYALKAIDISAQMSGLRGLVINYGPPPIEIDGPDGTPEHMLKLVRESFDNLKNLTVIHENMSANDTCCVMKSVKFMLFPNDLDASPRLITEALVRNVPVLVNSSIYGGWKYINEETGMFFDCPSLDKFCSPKRKQESEDRLANTLSLAMKNMLSKPFEHVSASFYKFWGFRNAAKTFASIINGISGTDYSSVCYIEYDKLLKRLRKIS